MQASVPAPFACTQSARRQALSALLEEDDIDAAIEAGLLGFAPCGDGCCTAASPLVQAQRRLRQAWDARDRHRARQARLARRAAAREARRGPPAAAMTAPATASIRPPLPPAAAAILARAKAKAAGRTPDESA